MKLIRSQGIDFSQRLITLTFKSEETKECKLVLLLCRIADLTEEAKCIVGFCVSTDFSSRSCDSAGDDNSLRER
jgi:hypothetical protein